MTGFRTHRTEVSAHTRCQKPQWVVPKPDTLSPSATLPCLYNLRLQTSGASSLESNLKRLPKETQAQKLSRRKDVTLIQILKGLGFTLMCRLPPPPQCRRRVSSPFWDVMCRVCRFLSKQEHSMGFYHSV